MERIIENNRVTISGTIENEFEFSHEVFGEGFYMTHLSIERKSGVIDKIPVMVSERMIAVNEEWTGQCVKISGQFRSYNRHSEDTSKPKLILYVFATEFEVIKKCIDINKIILDGYICKEPIYRTTPNGREVSDVLLAVNRAYKKTDYIPIICWGRNARYAESLRVGDRIEVEGRIQSRTYIKRIDEENVEEWVAFEVSCSKIEEIEETEEGE